MKQQRKQLEEQLRTAGCRMTKQRQVLLDVILEENCSSCKEIYYQASKRDPSIGTATVYRLVEKLEQIGAIDRKKMYRISEVRGNAGKGAGSVTLQDGRSLTLSAEELRRVTQAGLEKLGYLKDEKVLSVTWIEYTREL